MNSTSKHVDWEGLVYYDGKIKEYIQTTSASKEDQDQLRVDLEQLEKLLNTLTDSFTADKKHIYDHIEACRDRSATKEELENAVKELHNEIKAVTGIDLSNYATIDFVETKLKDLGDSVTLPDNLVTKEELSSFATKDELRELADQIGSIAPPEVDLSSLATKEELSAVDAKIPSVEGLASEIYVDAKVAEIKIPEVPTKVAELENDAGYITAADIPEVDLDNYYNRAETEALISDSINGITLPEIPTNVSTFTNDAGYLTAVPEEYVTEIELANQGYLTEVDIKHLATTTQVEEVETRVTTFENTVSSTYIKIEDGVTKSELDTAVSDVVASQVESLINDKIEDIVTEGVTVSSISYDEF